MRFVSTGCLHRARTGAVWRRIAVPLVPPNFARQSSHSSQTLLSPLCRHQHVSIPAEISHLKREPARQYSTSATATNVIVLRDYQEECVQACLSTIKGGITRIGVSSPTGSGKTTIFTAVGVLCNLFCWPSTLTPFSSSYIVSLLQMSSQHRV